VADKAMTLRLPEAQAELLNAVAEILELPVVEVVRLAVTEFIEHRRREPKFQQQLHDSMERISRAMNALLPSDDMGRTPETAPWPTQSSRMTASRSQVPGRSRPSKTAPP
jgi:hypothetical protein